jgi:hypothetical protein
MQTTVRVWGGRLPGLVRRRTALVTAVGAAALLGLGWMLVQYLKWHVFGTRVGVDAVEAFGVVRRFDIATLQGRFCLPSPHHRFGSSAL